MAYKIIGYLATLLTVGQTGIIGSSAGIIDPSAATVAALPTSATVVRSENYDPNPQYSFSYSVADGLTGDNKAQEETRNGDVIQGSYSLIEPDGSRRIVSYTADPINGFNAIVQKDPSITVKTAAVSAAPVAAAVRPTVVTSRLLTRPASVIATAAPAAIAIRPQAALLSAPLLRQPSLLTGPTVAATNVVTTNTGLLGLGLSGLGLGIGQGGSVYSSRALLAGAYGAGGIVKLH